MKNETTAPRVQLARNLLKRSLFGLMADKPIRKITIKEICERAGLNRSTFYNYYFDEYAVLRDMEQDMIDRLESKMLGSKTTDITLGSVAHFFKYIQDHSDEVRPYFVDPDFSGFRTEYAEKTSGIFARYLSGATPPPPVLSVVGASVGNKALAEKYFIYYITNGTMSLISKWFEDDCSTDAEEFARIVYSYCGAMFGTVTTIEYDAAHTKNRTLYNKT